MNFFKYLFLFFLSVISFNTFSACPSDVSAAFKSNLADPPYLICSTGGTYQGQSMGKCLFAVDSMNKTSSGFDIYARSTGETCQNITVLNGTDETEPEPDPVLSCTSDSCINPNNLRCPTGYVKGSFNGQNYCVKNNDPEPEPECPECDPEPNDQVVVDAVNDANDSITGSIGNLKNSLSDSFNDIKELLSDIADKVSNLANSSSDGDGGSENEGDGEEDGNGVDTSGFEVDVPIKNFEEQYQLDENIFYSNPQCPDDNILSMNFMGSTVTYAFSYAEICNSLNYLSYIIMIMSYLLSAFILIRA